LRPSPPSARYLRQAGEHAIRCCANQEAIGLLIKGLALLATLPDTPERAQQELSFQIVLGIPLRITKGSASPEVEQVYARARELADRLLSVAQSTQETALLLEAHHAQWCTAFWRGELSVARTHATRGMTLYDRWEHQSLAFRYGGHDSGVCCRDFGALVLWLLGYADQAQQRSQEALTLARELSHPYTLAEAFGYAAWLWQFRREGTAVREMAEAVITLAQEEGFAYWSAQSRILKGWALAEQGQGRQGIPEVRQGIADHRATGSEAARPYYLGLLAEAYKKMAQPAEGLNVLREALEIVHEAEVCF
jgi:predicted ATPase